jgi:uncharacterized phage-associated protein
MPTVSDVADYFTVMMRVDCAEGASDDLMTHLKLQRLVYYAQGFSLALNGEPLFDEPIEAQFHGPFCVPLCERYRNKRKLIDPYYRYRSIGKPIRSRLSLDEAERPFTRQQLKVLGIVNEHFAILTAGRLRKLTQSDRAWQVARFESKDEVMTLEDMRDSCMARINIDNE